MRKCVLFILLVFHSQLFAQEIIRNNDRYGCVDKTGKLIIPAIYTHLTGFNEGGYAMASLPIDNGVEDDEVLKFGIIDKLNRIVIPFKYDIMDNFDGDFAYFNIGFDTEHITGIPDSHEFWKRGIVDKKGKEYFVCIIQNGHAKMYEDEACTKLTEIVNHNIPVKCLKTGRNAQGFPVVTVKYGKKTAWTWVSRVTDDNHQVRDLKELQDEWKKKEEALSQEDLIELYNY